MAKIPRIASHHQIAAPSVSRNRCLAGNEIRRESKYGGLKGLGFIDSKCKRETGELAACRQRKRQMTRRKGWKKSKDGKGREPRNYSTTIHSALRKLAHCRKQTALQAGADPKHTHTRRMAASEQRKRGKTNSKTRIKQGSLQLLKGCTKRNSYTHQADPNTNTQARPHAHAPPHNKSTRISHLNCPNASQARWHTKISLRDTSNTKLVRFTSHTNTCTLSLRSLHLLLSREEYLAHPAVLHLLHVV